MTDTNHHPVPSAASIPRGSAAERTRRANAKSSLLVAVGLLLAIGSVLWLALGPGGSPRRPSSIAPATDALRVPVGEAVETILQAVQTQVRTGRHEEARAVLAEAVSNYPDQQPLRSAYADVLVALSRPAEAYEQYVAALSIGPRAAEAEFAAGTMANLTGRSALALEHYTAAQTADPANPIYPLYLAQVQRKLNQTEEAKASLLRVVNLQPDNAIGWGTLADIYLGENKLDLAQQHVARARRIEPLVGAWRLIEARILKRQSKPDEALLVMEGLSEPERQQVHNARLIAECHAMRGEMERAVTVVVAASDSNPADAELALEAAIWLQRTDQLDRAREYARRAQMLGSDRAAEVLAGLADEKAADDGPP
jgi:predicted Zn-dependent protease